jgi:hypothetical protein
MQGCLQRVFFNDVNGHRAVLAAGGWEVHAPRGPLLRRLPLHSS